MKTLRFVVAVLSMLVASISIASNQWYLGASQSYFNLGESPHWEGSLETGQAGLQIGKFLTDDLSVEVAYSANFNRDDFDIATLAGLVWMGDRADKYQPYILAGVNSYNTNDSIDHYHSQLVFGVGIGSDIADKLQLRADVRLMRGKCKDKNDFGFQLSVNHLFGATATPAPVAEVAESAAEPVVVKPKIRTVTIRLNVEFEFDSAEVLTIYGDQLEVIAAGMRDRDDIELVLEGHTDSLGSDSYNSDLSVRRAGAVKVKLVEDYGISSDRISASGYGESRPIASNESNEGRARDRRVVGEMSFSEVVVD